nr:DUF962 domain-containing protein [Pseudomonas sp. MD195_PC81_125]
MIPVFTLDSNRLPAEQLAVRTITTEIAVVENIKPFNSFAEFYPYYLSEHANSTCRRLHFIGTTLVIFILAMTLAKGAWLLLLALPLAGYSFAWIGHFFFEKNRPATFQHPLYSLLGDFVMYRDMILGRVAF